MAAIAEKHGTMTVATVSAHSAEPPVRDEVAQIWEEVQRMVIRMAGGDSAKIDKRLDIDGVMRHLETVQAADQKAAAKHGAVKKIFNRTLQCISKVGGMVADGASNAFGPANTCFNALTFVIGAWQSYSAAFESLAELLERCAEFFERLSYYEEMDVSLKKVACCQLKLFVDVCDKALQLKLKRRKLEMFLRHMFLEDDDIKDLLVQMERLTAREHGLVSAQTYKISQDAAQASQEAAEASKESVAKLNTLVEQGAAQRQEKAKQQYKEKVREAFFGKDNKETMEKWEEAFRRYKSELISGTGDWLLDEPLFTSWMSGHDSTDTDPIFAIEGGEGSGKTRIAARIIDLLQKRSVVGGSSTRSAVAYYFHEADLKEDAATSFRKKHIAARVSRSLLWQLALADQPFLKSMAGICDDRERLEDPADFWNQLLLENEDRANIESTFFIVLDGLGDNLESFSSLFQRLSEDAPRLRTRVLVTGGESAFEKLKREDGIRMTKLRLGTSNAKDVKFYIEARMNDMEILHDANRPGVADTRKTVLESLMGSTKGDYYITGAALDNIDRVDSLEEVEQCLEKAGGARSNQILQEIKRLNMALKPKEIEEINEIILWVKWGLKWMTPSQIETALELRGEPDTTNQQTSLRSLESKIRSKYASLFRINDDTVDFKVDEMADNIPDHNNADPILPQELNMVKHYLSTVCPKDVYDKFGFEDFFEQKLERKKNYICQDPNNAEITLALRCLRCLVDGQTTRNRHLRAYAADHVYSHLHNTDLSLADRDVKAQAGALLARLLSTDLGINALLEVDYGLDWEVEGAYKSRVLPGSWDRWVFSDRGSNLLRRWSQDSTVLDHLEDKGILKSLAENQMDGRSWCEAVALLTAKKLLMTETRGREKTDVFMLLNGLLQRLRLEETQEKQDFDNLVQSLWYPTMDDFNSVESWAYRHLDIKDDGSWQTRMVKLLSFLQNGKTITHQDVEARARQTLERYPEDWITSFNLADALGSGRSSESIDIMERVMDQLRNLKNDSAWRSDRNNPRTYAIMLETLSLRYWEMSERENTSRSAEKAADINLMALDEDHTWTGVYAKVVTSHLGRRGLWTHIVSYCEKLLGITDDGMNVAGKVVFVGTQERGRSFWDVLKNACLETDRWDLLTALWKEGIKRCEMQPRSPSQAARINNWYQICMAQRPGNEGVGLGMAEGLLRDGPAKGWTADIMNELIAFVLPLYTKQAFDRDSTPEAKTVATEKVMALYDTFDATPNRELDPLLKFSRFFHLNGDDATARRMLHFYVTQAIEMLSDDDVGNDLASFSVLSQVFTVFMDKENIIACWEMMAVSKRAEMRDYERKVEAWEKIHAPQPGSGDCLAVAARPEEVTVEEMLAGKASALVDVPVNRPERPLPAMAWCSGHCGFRLEMPSGIWVCEDCVGLVWVEEACYAQKAGAKKARALHCGGDHTMFRLPLCDEDWIRDIPHGSIRVGGKFISLEEWKANIKAKYVDVTEG